MENIEALNEIFSRGRVKTDQADLIHWGTDWTRSFEVAPQAVVFPERIDELVALVKLAREHSLKLVPSGGRTGLSGGAVASNDEIVVSFDRMNQIRAFNPTDRIVSCQAGVITQKLQEYALERGLFYPVDFASSGSSQIGGNIATNAGGIKVIRYGLTRDWIAGLTVVTGTGDIIRCNRGLVKNATGYDFRHLFIGSEGTLGFIVEAEIKLAPGPKPQRVMVLGVNDLNDILDLLQCFQQHVVLTAFEFFSELALRKVTNQGDVPRPFSEPCAFYALVEFDADADEEATIAFEEALDQGWVTTGVISQSDTQAAALWSLRENISESIAADTPYKNDLSVRISEVPGFLSDVDGIVNKHYPDLDVCWYGHIGDGNLHLNILKPESLTIDEFFERCHRINPELFSLIEQRGGSISAEHGVGLLKREFLPFSRSDAEIGLMRGLKEVFDPSGIMNPGKLFSV